MAFPVIDQGTGPAVLLLHGFADSRFLWRNQITPLVDAGFRVIAPDLRGFGDAPKPAAAIGSSGFNTLGARSMRPTSRVTRAASFKRRASASVDGTSATKIV